MLIVLMQALLTDLLRLLQAIVAALEPPVVKKRGKCVIV